MTTPLTDHTILVGLLTGEPIDSGRWTVLGHSAYATPSPAADIRIVIGVHRTAHMATATGLRLRAVHRRHGELDSTVLDFGWTGTDPFRVALLCHTTGTARPGPDFPRWWQQVENYRLLWTEGLAARR
ncbi:hypothetical protein [Streptomyces sp. NPDC102360]|uniref:hypothetical protein n=1 Tax=Streptomyces sp. NPDC102360 TaxID=3366160 RepID=UPI00380A1913